MLGKLCGNLSGNELTCNLSGNIRPQSSQIAEPLWTDPGLKSAISVRELISTLKKTKKQAQAGNQWSNILPKSSHSTQTVTLQLEADESHTSSAYVPKDQSKLRSSLKPISSSVFVESLLKQWPPTGSFTADWPVRCTLRSASVISRRDFTKTKTKTDL